MKTWTRASGNPAATARSQNPVTSVSSGSPAKPASVTQATSSFNWPSAIMRLRFDFHVLAARCRNEIHSHATTTISTAVVSAASSSGDTTMAAGTSSASAPSPARCDSGKYRRGEPLEQAVAEQIKRRPAEDDGGGLHVGVAAGMVQHQLVADRRDDDARRRSGCAGRCSRCARCGRDRRRRRSSWLPRSAPMLK